jgi:cytochrome c-type biogenesis protein
MADAVLLTAAFSAGVVTFFSPCATALLPVYLSYYLTSGTPETAPREEPSRPSRLLIGGLAAAIVGSGLLVGALVDRILSAGARGAIDAVVGVAGALLVGIGGYLALEAARGLEPAARAALRSRIVRGLVVGAAASLGIATVYLTIGLAFNLGLSQFPSALPWIAFASAWLVVALGVLLVLGRNPLSFLPKVRGPRGRNVAAFYLFGIGYALIASGCFLPVFALVVGFALALGVGDAAQVMVAYAAGSAVVLLTVSVSAGAAEGLVFRTIRAWRKHVYRLGGVIVILSGAYVLWYDWTFLLSRGV